MAINTYLSIITLNVNGTVTPEVVDMIKKTTKKSNSANDTFLIVPPLIK